MGIAVIGTVFVDIKGYPLTTYIPAGRNAGRVIQSHGGVARNVAEDIANVELRPTFVSLVDETGIGTEVVESLRSHKVDVSHIRTVPDGMGIWLAVFNEQGDVVASISKRPELDEIVRIMEEEGDEIFADCDSIALEIDMERDIVKLAIKYAKKYNKPVYALVSNMSIALERRDMLREVSCFVCNQEEAGILFSEEYKGVEPEEMVEILRHKVGVSGIPSMVVTMGAQGAVYAGSDGEYGIMPAQDVEVRDTTGAGDAFFAGVCIGLTYGKTLGEASSIGTRLAASVIRTTQNSCPRFLPEEFGLSVKFD